MSAIKVRKMSVNEQLQQLFSEYRGSGEAQAVSLKRVAEWALKSGRFSLGPADPTERLARLMAVALREETFEDAKGRRVRKNHAIRKVELNSDGEPVQTTLWSDMFTADRKHMHLSFQQRRGGILGDCKQLKTDADYFNEARLQGKSPIGMSYNFEEDLAELEQPTTYEGLDESEAADLEE